MLRTVALLLVFTLTAPVAAQQPDGWARKMFAKDGETRTEHDFGIIPRGSILSHKFTVTNIYAVPMQITEIRVSCGCVTATTANQTLQPHQSTTIDVTMNARTFTGPKAVSIYVTVGPQFVSTATLKVSANSRSDVVLNPGSVTFGVVPQGQTSTQTVDVEYAGPLDWRVTGIVQNDFPLDVRAEERVRQPGRVVVRLHVALRSEAPAGAHKYELQIQTSDKSGPLLPLLVEATVQAPLAVAPDKLNFRTAKVGQAVTNQVIVRGNNKPFRILKVEGEGDGVRVEQPTEGKALPSHVVRIIFEPAAAGSVKRQIVFKTDLERDAITTLTVEGVGVP